MDLIERYIQSVRLFLPKRQRDDVAKELASDLRAEAADRESEFGRPLSEREHAELLRRYGHPMLIAARYRPARYLVGPVLYPIYRQALTLILGLIVAGNLAALSWMAVRGASWPELGAGLTSLLHDVLNVAGFITLLAVCLEWSLTRSKVFERWDPTSIGPADGSMRLAGRTVHRAVFDVARTDRLVRRGLDEAGPPLQARSIPEFVMMAVLGAWVVLGLVFPYLVFGSGAAMLAWAPWVQAAWPLVAIVVVFALVDQYLRLTRPAAAFVRVIRVVWANAGWVLIVSLLAVDRRWVVWIGTMEEWERFGALIAVAGRTWSIADVVNAVISMTLAAVALASLAGPAWRVARLIGRRIANTAHA